MWKEFKEFATKGNVVDLAIGVIIGGGFQKIVNSLVNDIIMPFVSIFTGKIDFNDMVLTFGNTSIKYGSFITNVINFLIIAFSVFLMVRYINKLNKTLEEKSKEFNQKLEKENKFFKKKKKNQEQDSVPVPTTKICPFCLSEINIKASRCPHCTSILDEKEEIVGEQLEISEK
ncbi:MAG: large conductance mechanosensitive channel protein MscL [Clostridia bacterium]|nr:large conductance mechanosensitive channel protein MscL [Clostridia bacterium]